MLQVWHTRPMSARYVMLIGLDYHTKGKLSMRILRANAEGYPFICETFEDFN